MRNAAKVCVRHVLGVIRVLYLEVDLSRVNDDKTDPAFDAQVEKAEEEVEEIAVAAANHLSLS